MSPKWNNDKDRQKKWKEDVLKQKAEELQINTFMIFWSREKQWDPYMHPVSCPEEMFHTQHAAKIMMRWVGNTTLVDSFGRTISQHVESTTTANLSPMGVKYHPEGWKRLPNCGCGSMTTGRKSARGIQKIRLNVVHKSLIRGKLYCLPTYNLAKNIVTEELFGLCCDLFMNQFVIDRRHFLTSTLTY